MIGVVMAPGSRRSQVMLDEIEQFTTDLECCEVEEVPDRLNFNILKCSMQADQRVLKHVIGCLPSPERWVVPKHLAGKFQKPFACMIQKQGLGPFVTRLRKVYESLELCVRTDWHGVAFVWDSRDRCP